VKLLLVVAVVLVIAGTICPQPSLGPVWLRFLIRPQKKRPAPELACLRTAELLELAGCFRSTSALFESPRYKGKNLMASENRVHTRTVHDCGIRQRDVPNSPRSQNRGRSWKSLRSIAKALGVSPALLVKRAKAED